MNGLIFVPIAFVFYFLRKERLDRKIKAYINEKNGRYLSEFQPSLYKRIYVVKYEDAQKNIRKVRVYKNTFHVVFADDEVIEELNN
jgi:hypothetical protein